METLERTGSDEGTPDQQPSSRLGSPKRDTSRTTGDYVKIGGGVVLVLALVYWAFVEEKIRSTAVTVVIAVAASAGIWIGANLLFNQVRGRWLFFQTTAFAIVGALIGIMLHGNLVTIGSGSGFLSWVIGPLAGAVLRRRRLPPRWTD